MAVFARHLPATRPLPTLDDGPQYETSEPSDAGPGP